MCVLCLELKQKYCERTDRTEKMPKKDTKLQKLSESIQYTIDEMRGLGIEGLDQLFLEIYLELPNGIPSHDTIQRLFSILNGDELQSMLVNILVRIVTVAGKK